MCEWVDCIYIAQGLLSAIYGVGGQKDVVTITLRTITIVHSDRWPPTRTQHVLDDYYYVEGAVWVHSEWRNGH